MSDVKRYVVTCDCMSEAAWGDYVRHDDYATLEAESAKLRASKTALRVAILKYLELEFARLNGKEVGRG